MCLELDLLVAINYYDFELEVLFSLSLRLLIVRNLCVILLPIIMDCYMYRLDNEIFLIIQDVPYIYLF